MSSVHVIFIHGLANKPAPDALRRIWLGALGEATGTSEGFDLGEEGVGSTFIYWADLFYGEPLAATDYESVGAELQAEFAEAPEVPDDAWSDRLAQRFGEEGLEGIDEAPVEPGDPYERVPLPGPLKRRLMASFVREAHDYLFDVGGIRRTVRQRVLDALDACPDGARIVVLGHSQGSFIAYDVLGLDACRTVHGFMTVGSPLGVDEVQDRLDWTRMDGFPPKLEGDWVNVFDPYDPVSRPDPWLANDFRKGGQKVVIDVLEENWGRWRHSATKYFKGAELRRHLRRLCDRGGAELGRR